MLKRFMMSALFIFIVLLSGCSEHKKGELIVNDDKSLKEDLKILGQQRVFFGHQSVGGNIMDGLREIITENSDSTLRVQKRDSTLNLHSAFFLEGLIGENLHPKTKCDDFIKAVDELAPEGLTIALMKFCYLDVSAQTDPDKVFNDYSATVRSLQQKNPSITFVHVTAPLTAEADILRRVYRFLRGRSIDHNADNAARQKFNERIRKEFPNEPVFDLAAIESTRPDGTREIFKTDSGTFFGLAKEYASDEGHLNEFGRKIAARELVHALAKAARVHLVK